MAWSGPDPDYAYDWGDARKTRLYDIVRDTGAKTIRYIYDFGDNWEHIIKIEKWSEHGGPEGLPLLLDAKGRTPPEDIGGAPGYALFLAARRNPEHPDYAHFHDVAADNFDPQVINRAALNDALNALAGQWRRNPRKT